MAIRIVRNASGNCIQFLGSSQPAYWNSCLSGAVNSEDNTRVDVINDIRTTNTDNPFFEFFGIPYTEFRDKDGGTFADATTAAAYITTQANVAAGGAIEFSATDTLDVSRDATNTNILFSTGDSYGVHAIKAVAQANSNITIKEHTDSGVNIYEDIRPANVTINGDAPTSVTVTAVVNTLNALFEVTPLGLGGVDPTTSYTTVSNISLSSEVAGDVTLSGGYATKGANTGEPQNDWIASTVKYIGEEGEYVEMDWGTAPNGTTDYGSDFVMGFFSDYVRSGTDPSYAYEGMDMGMRLRGLETYEFHDYGIVIENGYYNNPHTRQKFRMGLDSDRRLYISFYDEESEEWQVAVRSAFPTQSEEYGVVFFIKEENARFKWSGLNAEEIDPASFNVQYRYIESPDGEFYYPLFSNEQQANWVDQLNSGSGTSHIHLFADEVPSQNQWYMPATGGTHSGASAPVNTDSITYTEILTGDDANYAPSNYGAVTYSVSENTPLNYQIDPQGANWTTTISGQPAGMSYSLGMLVGTTPEVAGIIADNPSDEYVVTVTRTNAFGSSTGTLTLTVNNLTQTITPISGFTHVAGTTSLVDPDTLEAGSAVSIDDMLEQGKRMVFSASFLNGLYADIDNNDGSLKSVLIGVLKSSADLSNLTRTALDIGFSLWKESNGVKYLSFVHNGYTIQTVSIGTGNFTYDLVFFHDAASNKLHVTQYGVAGGTGATMDTPTIISGYHLTPGASDVELVVGLAINSTNDVDITTTGITEVDNPSVISTSWTKAVDLSGGNEHYAQPSTSSASIYQPLRMGGYNNQIAGPTAAGYTSIASGSQPWAVSCVFKIDGNSSNQHVWNQGEGAGSTDDNIYLRVDSFGALYFGWGRSGAINEYLIATNLGSGAWYGAYIAHNGTRLSGSSASVANLSAAFDIKLMFYSGGSWIFNPNPQGAGAGQWTSTGGRMDRQFLGTFTVGGRGANRNFHGKVASTVVTTLRRNVLMPSNAEVEMMVTDPMGWLNDYKVGNPYRVTGGTTENSSFALNNYQADYGTQVWLMGDGTNDAYSRIRNQVRPSNYFYTVLDGQSLVSNDIETVSIPGLS